MLRFTILFVFTILYTTASGQSIDSIQIGSGGGFTGQITVYTVIKNKIYKGRGLGKIKYSEQAKLSCKNKGIIRKGAKKIIKKKISINSPSNTYKLITLYSKGKKTEIIWGDPSSPCPKEIEEYYDKVSKIISKLKFAPL